MLGVAAPKPAIWSNTCRSSTSFRSTRDRLTAIVPGCEHVFALIGSRPMLPPISERLLSTSTAYVSAKFELERAIRDARGSGFSDDDIARLLGFSRPMIEAVAGVPGPVSGGRRRGGW